MFEILATDGRARRGVLHTVHGDIQTPVFMNVGTCAAIKGGVNTVELEKLAEAIDAELPLEEEYDTLGGMVFSAFTSIPEEGSKPEVTIHGLHVQVENICDHRIDTALVSKVIPEKDEDDSTEEKEEN